MSQPKLVIKIVDSGTIYHDPDKGDRYSLSGHMWWELHDSDGKVTPYGFAPDPKHQGFPIAPGYVYPDDNIKYDFNPAKGDYQREFEISDSQVKTLKEFGSNSFEGKFKFSSTYNVASNSCINFTYKALDMIGFAPKGYDGDVWPTFNIDNIKALPSSNKSDTKIFISNDGGLFFLDDKKQMTIKLFSDANAIDKTKTNSLAINSAKLGSQKTLIKDVNNKKVAEFEVRKGDQTGIFNNSLLLKAEAKFLTKNGEEVSQDNAIIKFSDDQLNQLTLIRTDLSATLKDNTSSTLSTILNTLDSSIEITANFLTFQAQKTAEIILTKIKSDKYLDSLIGSVLANIILGENDAKQISKNLAKGQLNSLVTSLLDENIRKILIDSGMTTTQINNLVGPKAVNYAVTYDNSGNKIITAYDANGNLIGPTLNGTIYTAILNFAISAADSSGWSSEEYAQAAKIAIASAIVSAIVTTVLTAIAPGIGTVAGIVISAVVCALVVGPLVVYADDQYKITEDIFIMMRDLVKDLVKDPVNSTNDFDPIDFNKKLLKYYTDSIDNFGKYGKNILIGGYNLFGGNYGKSFSSGQYPDSYASLKITAKADGTGNIIQGLDPQGVVAIAREYYHDDIFGSSGSDNLIGKSGTNTIQGFEGNDHIEGRGDVDLLIGGAGDDEVFGGNGDDQIYGSEGNDNLFGGNGNDVIIGGTGASINGVGSLEDGNDFIQGGNGNDQIMAEAGDDEIQGNDGNDTILGGTGNDRIQGGDGDDSILSEDGDDMILGGSGSDIIDGGNGVDYIEGGEGNDNIRGGDGNDEILGNSGVDIIYGDVGNDLINSGSQDDLVLGGIGNDIIYGADGDDSLSGEFGNDYLIGAQGSDIVDGGAGDDVLLGGIGNDTITTGEGNDTIIYKIGDGIDTIIETDINGNDILKLSEINSKLSNNTTDKLKLTKSGTQLIIEFKDDSGSIITSDKITVTNQFGGSQINGTGSEILKKIEFADGKYIDLALLNIPVNDGEILVKNSDYKIAENIDTAIQEELALGYNDLMQNQEEQPNLQSSYNANNYNNSGEQDEIDSEKYNDVQWRSMKKKRSIFGGHYTVWYKYYEQNLSGTNGNDRLVGSWWSENIYGGNGDDQLHGGDGNDNIFGGVGNDILHGGAKDDKVYGQAGEDLIYGGSGNDYLDGGTENDAIYANSGDDIVNGDLGDDYLEGNEGNDSITDLDGNNIIIAGLGNDVVVGGAGNDKIEGNDNADNIKAGDGNNLIYGNGGNDLINSGSGNDTIYGQEGFDLINSGAGDDYISGGAGDDIINGEDGNDIIFGDIGIDQISGGNGVDYIYGGLGVDILKGEAGDDQIKGGDSDDLIEGGADNDRLYGQLGSDKIFGDDGNDEIYGGLKGDVLEGGNGDDFIDAGLGNDILVDGAGSDILDAGPYTTGSSSGDGTDSDIVILTKENGLSASIDVIKNWNKNEDKIILKVNYQTPISFADIQENMVQNLANAEINLSNGQKIIIENINISDINSSNFKIGLSGGKNNDILFGTDGEDIIFGDVGDDKIYGGEGNDELWGGKGCDELYGEAGDDILRYEADGKYGDSNGDVAKLYDANVEAKYSGYSHNYGHPAHYFEDIARHYRISDGLNQIAYNPNNDVVIDRVDLVSKLIDFQNGVKLSYGFILSDGLLRAYPASNSEWNVSLMGADLQEYEYTKSNKYSVKNFLSSTLTDITGYNRTFDKFVGGSGVNTILMTEGNDVLALDDPTSPTGSSGAGASNSARIQDISVIYAGAGDDVINFTTQKYSYGDLVIYGATGNDKLWLSSGNDQIFGAEGNDEIYSGAGDDKINGGNGNDIIYGGVGNDSIEGGNGINQLFGEDGDDVFIAGNVGDIINGGNGSDTVSYVNSTSQINVNLNIDQNNAGVVNNFFANQNIISIENIIGSAFDDNLLGNSFDNILNGANGNDYLAGGSGCDLYVYNFNSGTDIINETGNDADILRFSGGIKDLDLSFAINGDDLEIQVGDNVANKVIIKNQVTQNSIETIKINPVYNISKKFFITNEDQELVFYNPLEELNLEQLNSQELNSQELNSQGLNSQRRNFKSLSAIYGTLIFDEVFNKFTYKSNANFHGIDEIEIAEEDGVRSKFSIFVNGVNDSPIFSSLGKIQNKEVKVEEEWNINLKDYFIDVDNYLSRDDLSISLKLKGFDNLPDWINFDSQAGILSGKIGRDGKLNFNVTATDKYQAFLSDEFHINITRNLVDDFKPTTQIVQIAGTEVADVIIATPNSSDIISTGAGDDVINFTKDNDWKEASDGSYFVAWNVYSGDKINVTGKQRSFDAFDGGEGNDKLNLTNANDVIFLDDSIVSNIGDIAKLASIEEIDASDGDDVIDLTSLTFVYEDIILNGGNGNDVLWGNNGDDQINGDEGNDNLQGGEGDDVINGGNGNDLIKGYFGNDKIIGGSGFDVMIGGIGNDQFIFSDKSDSIGSFNNLNEADIVLDFICNEDKIDLSTLGFDSIAQGQGSNLSANGLEFYFKNGYTIIDDPNSNFAVKLSGEMQLANSDFNF